MFGVPTLHQCLNGDTHAAKLAIVTPRHSCESPGSVQLHLRCQSEEDSKCAAVAGECQFLRVIIQSDNTCWCDCFHRSIISAVHAVAIIIPRHVPDPVGRHEIWGAWGGDEIPSTWDDSRAGLVESDATASSIPSVFGRAMTWRSWCILCLLCHY